MQKINILDSIETLESLEAPAWGDVEWWFGVGAFVVVVGIGVAIT